MCVLTFDKYFSAFTWFCCFFCEKDLCICYDQLKLDSFIYHLTGQKEQGIQGQNYVQLSGIIHAINVLGTARQKFYLFKEDFFF